MSSGTALVAVIQMARGQLTKQAAEFLHWFLYLSVAVTFALFLGQWVTLMFGTEELQQAWRIINSVYGFQFWGLTLVLGILVPLVLVAVPRFGRDPKLLTLAAVFSAVGAYSFRAVLIYAGQLTQIYY